MEMNLFNVLDLMGTAAFAVSGALAAMKRKLDLFGIVIIAFVTAIGGGTLRDILVGNTPVSWMGSIVYVYLIMGVTVLAIFFRHQLYHLKTSLFLFDTIGLGIFTIIGVETGIDSGLHPMISSVLGMLSGAFGGVLRDILCNEIPVIFRKEIYATACLLGAAVFVVMHHYNIADHIIYSTTTLLVITVRILAVRYDIRLPRFQIMHK